MADDSIDNDSIYIAFDATLEEFVDVHMRQVWRSREWQHRLRSMIAAGVVGSALVTVIVDGLIGRPVGSDLVVAGVLGGFAGSMCGPLYGRILERGVRRMLLEKYAARLPMRCEIELRPTCLWVRQDGVEIALDWTTARAVEDTLDGVEIWFDWGLVVARNRAFAASSDRERFVNRARASSSPTPTLSI